MVFLCGGRELGEKNQPQRTQRYAEAALHTTAVKVVVLCVRVLCLPLHPLRTSASSAVDSSLMRPPRLILPALPAGRLPSYDDRRQVLVSHRLVERRKIGLHYLIQLLQLCVNLRLQFLVDDD